MEQVLYEIDVTSQDIACGLQEDEDCCAIALAVNREIGKLCQVGYGYGPGENPYIVLNGLVELPIKKEDGSPVRVYSGRFPMRIAESDALTNDRATELRAWLMEFDDDKGVNPIKVEVLSGNFA